MAIFDSDKLKSLASKAKNVMNNLDDLKDKADDLGDIVEAVKSGKFTDILKEIGDVIGSSPDSGEAQGIVKKLKDILNDITEGDGLEALKSVGKLATTNDDVKDTIEKFGGEGAADFISKAIKSFLK